MSAIPPDIRKRLVRTIVAGIAASFVVAGGMRSDGSPRASAPTIATAVARIEADVQHLVAAREAQLADLTARTLGDPDLRSKRLP